jgi:hypothetical protein
MTCSSMRGDERTALSNSLGGQRSCSLLNNFGFKFSAVGRVLIEEFRILLSVLGEEQMDPIRIMGAGPAGLTAAITLARAGREVLVYERAADVGTRHDGDYEGIENWSTRADVWEEFATWGLANNFRGAPIYAGTLFGPGFRESARFEDSNPLCYFVSRMRPTFVWMTC